MKKILLPILAFVAIAAAQVPQYKFGPMWVDSAVARGLYKDSLSTPTVKANTFEVASGSGNTITQGSGSMILTSPSTIRLHGAFGTAVTGPLSTEGGDITAAGAEGAPGIFNIFSDEGDDNIDRWRIKNDGSGSMYFESFSSGAWMSLFSMTSGGLFTTGGLSVYDLVGTGNRFVIARADGTVGDTTITIPTAPTFASTLAVLGYYAYNSGDIYPVNVGVICNTNMLCLSNESGNTGNTPPASAGTYLDNPSTYQYWNVFDTFEAYQRFVLTNLMVGPGN